MCAIVDANVANALFSTEAGVKFAEWINSGRGRLVASGRLLEELNSTTARDWIREALIAGRIMDVSEADVRTRTKELESTHVCTSNDPHVVALAQVSGARLLYSHDKDLQSDFKNKRLIDRPRGKVYSTLANNNFLRVHKDLLARRDLCSHA